MAGKPTNAASGTLEPKTPSQDPVLAELYFLRRHVDESFSKLYGQNQQLIRLVRDFLSIPNRGRPRHANITLGAEMRAAGKPWRPIILKCLRPRSFYDSEEKYKAAIAGFKDEGK